MIIDILICCRRDHIQYLDACLRSIKKFATGFRFIVIAVPSSQTSDFKKYSDEWPGLVIIKERINDDGTKFNAQQLAKCMADTYCDNPDWIYFIDSDCILKEPTNIPLDYFADGKPILAVQPYDTLPFKDGEGSKVWQAHTERALGFQCRYETMRRHGAIHSPRVLKSLRYYVAHIQRMDFSKFVLSQKDEFPQGFSEFNVIGSFAMAVFPDCYHWVDVSKEELRNPVAQFWTQDPTRPGRPSDAERDLFVRLGLYS